MAETAKTCPKCGAVMTLHERPKPKGSSAMFMAEDHWVCENTQCRHVEAVEYAELASTGRRGA